MKIPHIQINKTDEGLLTVTVKDYELFDYVEDHLIENHDLEYDYSLESEKNGVSAYTMYFPKGTPENKIKKALNELSHAEIERIFKLNNP